MYSLRTFSTCHVIPAGVGSGVVPMYTIVLPIQISASRSNWRPFTFPVQSRTTIDHGGEQASGGMYVPVAGPAEPEGPKAWVSPRGAGDHAAAGRTNSR